MKKIRVIVIMVITVLLVCSLSVLLTACKDKQNETKTVILRILENDTAKKEGYLDRLLNAFNEKYKDQGVTAVDANMDEYSDLEKDGPYGHGPDVLYQANDILMSYVEKHHIIPLDVKNMECYDKIPQNAWNAFKYSYDGNEVYCGIPVNV